ncbi:MAG: hypothetical protein ACYCVL_08845 [Gemmatimonadaceae bacterium]
MVVAVALAVGGAVWQAGTFRQQRTRRFTRSSREWEVPEWQVARFLAHGQPLQAVGFGSGGSITTLVQQAPRAIYQFEYSNPQVVTGGLTQWWNPAAPGVLPLDTPTDVVGVTPDGVPLYLDSSTATVKTSTISGQRVLVAVLDTLPVVQSACALDTRTIAFVESIHPDTVFIRRIGQSVPRAVPLMATPGDSLPPSWTGARFGGSMGSGCALWAPHWRRVATIVDSTIRSEGRLRWASTTPAWWRRLLAWVARRAVRPEFAEDVTVFPGGVAVLSDAGTAIDLYAMDSGEYLRSMPLPRPALRIAGAGPRIFTLRQARDSILLASYVLPQMARALAPQAGGLPAETASPPKWLRVLRKQSR